MTTRYEVEFQQRGATRWNIIGRDWSDVEPAAKYAEDLKRQYGDRAVRVIRVSRDIIAEVDLLTLGG
jgi:hypothetical protein